MPHLDAMEDGVPTKKDRYGMDWYYPNCHICGESVPSWSYIRGLSYTCPSCKKLMVQLKLGAEKETKKTAKLKTAAKRIARVADVSKYQDAIAWVEKNLHRSGWFQSTEEIMVALELICRRIKANHQVKVLDYRVDFVLPDYKVVLEIDGDIYSQMT